MDSINILSKQKIDLRESAFSLEQKAAFLDELLSFIEDKVFGFLMEQTESEENLTISRAKKLLNSKSA